MPVITQRNSGGRPLRSWVFCNFLPQPPERFHRIGNLLFAELELEGGPSTIQGLYDSIGL